jgi:hypothetical protein
MAEITQDPPYSAKVYNALKSKIEGFKLTQQEFEQRISDPAYQKNVYSALKEKVGGFNLGEDEFYSRLSPLKKKVDTSVPGSVPSQVIPESSGPGLTGLPLSPPDPKYAPIINDMIAGQGKSPEQFRDEFAMNRAQEQGARDFITQTDQQQRPELYKEQNPMHSFNKSLWNLLSNTLPAAGAAVAAALTTGRPLEDRLAGMRRTETMTDDQDKEYKKEADKTKVALLKWADEQSKQGGKVSQELVSRISEVNDPIDAINWVSSTMGQATGQIPLSVATGGASSFAQEAGSIYLESVKKIAAERGIDIEQVIDQGLDSPAQALAWGAAAGMLDRVGARGVLGASRKMFASGLRDRAKEMIKSGVIEGGTEYTQTFFEQIGTDQAAGKEFADAFSGAFTSGKAQDRLEALAAGIVSGPGISAGMSAVSKVREQFTQAAKPEQTLTTPVGDLGAKQDEQPLEQPKQEESPVEPQQPQSTEEQLKDVDQKTGAIIPRETKGIPKTDPKYDDIKTELTKANKITTDEAGNIVVKQNSGAPSQWYTDLELIAGNKDTALNKYLEGMQDDGDFKREFGDWENQIMKEYGRAGNEYSIKAGTIKDADPNAYAWTQSDDKGNPVIVFNPKKIRREENFGAVKKAYRDQVISKTKATPEQREEYRKLYDKVVDKLRDLKLHLIHEVLTNKQKGPVTVEDHIRSLKEIERLNGVPLIKDYYGQPLILMHGGSVDIGKTRKFLKPGDEGYIAQDIMTNQGIYFSRAPKGMKGYARFGKDGPGPGKGKDVYYAYLKAKNPYYVNDPRAQRDYKLESSESISKKDAAALKAKGYDAVIWDKESKNPDPMFTIPKKEVIVFEPDQVKIIGSYREGLYDDRTDSDAAEPGEPASPTPPPNNPITDAPTTGQPISSKAEQSANIGTGTERNIPEAQQEESTRGGVDQEVGEGVSKPDIYKLAGKTIDFEGKSGVVKSIEKRGNNYVATFEDGDKKVISNDREADDHYLLYQVGIKSSPSGNELKQVGSNLKIEWDERRIGSAFGDVGASLIKHYTDNGETKVDYDRLLDQARKIQKADKRESDNIPTEITAEALQYEFSYNDNFDDLRSAVEKGGFENSQNTIERMLEVGVPVPEDIINEALSESQRETLVQVGDFMNVARRAPKKAEEILAGMNKKNLQFLTKKGFLEADAEMPYLTEKGKIVSAVLSPKVSKTAKYAQPEPLRPFDILKYQPVAIKKDAPRHSVSDQVNKSSTPTSEGFQEVEFEWLGQPKRGRVIKVEKDRVKIKGSDGTTYTKKLSDIKKVPAAVKEQAKKMAKKDADFTQSVKGLTSKLDEIVRKTKKPSGPQSGQANFRINPMFYLDQIDKIITEKVINVRKIEDYISRVISRGVQHSNYMVRNAAGMLQNIIGGLSYTHGDLKNKLEYTGNKNYANVYAKALADDLYKIIDSDHVSLERVHLVLDPDAFPLEENKMGFEADYESGTAKAVMNPELRYEDLNEPEQRLYDLLRLTNDFVHEWHRKQGLISEETYENHKGKYIARLYEEFELIPPDVQEEFNKSRADFDMFRRRKDIEEIDLEILKDPVYATAKRVAQMMRNQAIFEYADAINESKIAVSDSAFPNSTRLGTPDTKPFYGSLTGKYVPNYIAQDFKGFFYANKALDHLYSAFKGYDKNIARQVLKKSKTVYNPLVQLGNFLSNYSFAFWTGVDPLTFSKNLVRGRGELNNQGRYYFDLLEAGVLGSDLTIGDLQPVLDPGNPNAILGKAQNAIKAAISGTKAGKALIKFDDFASRLYSKTDDMSKMSAYISLREDYGYSKDEAIQRVYEGFQNYATVGKAFDMAAKTPVVGNPYIKFKADLARIIKNAATRRPLTTMAYLMLLRLTAELLSELSGEDEEERRARERRPFIPKLNLPFMDPIPLTWQVPGVGEVNVARFISPYYVYDKGDKNDIVNEVTDWLPYQFEMAGLSKSKDIKVPIPEMADVLLGVYAQVALDRDFRGLSIRDPKGNEFITVATPDEQIINSLNYIARSQVPMFRSGQDMISALMGEPDYYGRERTITQAILNNIIKVQAFGPEQAKNQLEKEIRYKVAKFDSYTRDIGMLKGVLRRDLQKIMELNLPEPRKNERFKAEIDKFKLRVAEKLQDQVEIVKSIEEPKELLKNIE